MKLGDYSKHKKIKSKIKLRIFIVDSIQNYLLFLKQILNIFIPFFGIFSMSFIFLLKWRTIKFSLKTGNKRTVFTLWHDFRPLTSYYIKTYINISDETIEWRFKYFFDGNIFCIFKVIALFYYLYGYSKKYQTNHIKQEMFTIYICFVFLLLFIDIYLHVFCYIIFGEFFSYKISPNKKQIWFNHKNNHFSSS